MALGVWGQLHGKRIQTPSIPGWDPCVLLPLVPGLLRWGSRSIFSFTCLGLPVTSPHAAAWLVCPRVSDMGFVPLLLSLAGQPLAFTHLHLSIVALYNPQPECFSKNFDSCNIPGYLPGVWMKFRGFKNLDVQNVFFFFFWCISLLVRTHNMKFSIFTNLKYTIQGR